MKLTWRRMVCLDKIPLIIDHNSAVSFNQILILLHNLIVETQTALQLGLFFSWMYWKDLASNQAAWASEKYKGH